jgi:hypothetical protein
VTADLIDLKPAVLLQFLDYVPTIQSTILILTSFNSTHFLHTCQLLNTHGIHTTFPFPRSIDRQAHRAGRAVLSIKNPRRISLPCLKGTTANDLSRFFRDRSGFPARPFLAMNNNPQKGKRHE